VNLTAALVRFTFDPLVVAGVVAEGERTRAAAIATAVAERSERDARWRKAHGA